MSDRTRADKVIHGIKNHPALSYLFLAISFVIVAGTFTESIDKIWSFVDKLTEKSPVVDITPNPVPGPASDNGTTANNKPEATTPTKTQSEQTPTQEVDCHADDPDIQCLFR